MGKRSDTGSRSEKSCCCKVLASESHNNHTNKTSLFIPRAPRTPPQLQHLHTTSPHHLQRQHSIALLNSCQHLALSVPNLPCLSNPSRPIQLDHHTTTTPPPPPPHPVFHMPTCSRESERDWIERFETETVKLPLIPHCSCTPLPRIPPVDDHRSIVHRLDDDGDDQGGDGFNGIDCFVCLTLCWLLCMF